MYDKLIQWSKKNFSHLPWRENRSMYGTLVSEIMLQQTTVGTVLNHYERFLKKFPTIKSLAQSSEEELLIEWKGLGYYRRAKNLKKISEQIFLQFNGKIPEAFDDLMSLNGIGPYTANAILAIGLDQKALAIDANLERVISRLFMLDEIKGAKLTKKIYELFNANEIFNFKKISYRELNEAIMDLGRTYCKVSTVECLNCPLNKVCKANINRCQLEYPKADKIKLKENFELSLIRIIVKKNDEVLMFQKAENEWLHGQWELPTFILESGDKKLKQYPDLKSKISKFDGEYKTSITKYKIVNYIKVMNEANFKKITKDKKYIFRKFDRSSNLSTASIKALAKIKS